MDPSELKPASYKSRSSIDTTPEAQEEKRAKTTIPAEIRQTETFLQKFTKYFFQTDPETVKNNLIEDYVVPAIKDAVLGVIDMFFYKDGGGSGRSSSSGPYVSYNSKYRGNRPSGRGNEDVNRQHRYDYRDLCWNTRGQAEATLASLWEILDEYKMVRVADVYDLAGKTVSGDSTGNDYGWRDLSGSEVQRTYDGKYVIKLPTAVSLK